MSKREVDRIRKELKLLRKEPGNSKCADCGGSQSTWTSTNIGVFVCIDCSGVHRGMGRHISFVQSITLDDWTQSAFEEFKSKGGNKKVNKMYEATMPKSEKPTAKTDKYTIAQFIKNKYQYKTWYSEPKSKPTKKPKPPKPKPKPIKSQKTNNNSNYNYNRDNDMKEQQKPTQPRVVQQTFNIFDEANNNNNNDPFSNNSNNNNNNNDPFDNNSNANANNTGDQNDIFNTINNNVQNTNNNNNNTGFDKNDDDSFWGGIGSNNEPDQKKLQQEKKSILDKFKQPPKVSATAHGQQIFTQLPNNNQNNIMGMNGIMMTPQMQQQQMMQAQRMKMIQAQQMAQQQQQQQSVKLSGTSNLSALYKQGNQKQQIFGGMNYNNQLQYQNQHQNQNQNQMFGGMWS